jgi:hypothetical protein
MKTSRSALQKCAQALAVTGLALGLHLDSSAQSIAPPPGMIAWWPGDGNANDIYGTNHGVLLGGATATIGGKVGQAFDLNGTSGFVEVPDSPDLDFPGSMTVEMWVMPYVPLSEQKVWARLVDKNDGPLGQHGWNAWTTGTANDPLGVGKLALGAADASGQGRSLVTSQADLLWPYQFGHFAATYNQQLGETTLYVNGQIVAEGNVGVFRIPKVPNPLRIGAGNFSSTSENLFRGRIDELALYNRALGSNEIAAIYAAGAVGKCKDPLILQHPSPQTQIGYWGNSATFTVAAKGTQPLRYQWRKDGVPVASATSSALTLTNLYWTDSGDYSVTVTNSAGAVTTNPGRLEVGVVDMSFALYQPVEIIVFLQKCKSLTEFPVILFVAQHSNLERTLPYSEICLAGGVVWPIRNRSQTTIKRARQT